MLYEALTGELPFVGPALEVMMNKQRKEPVPPRLLQPSTPAELDQLCQALLRFDPNKRADGPEILRRLGVAPSPSDARSSRPSLTSTPPFVGRAGELGELGAAYERSRKRAVVVHVHGESGVGKSALVRRFTEALKLEEPDVVILGGACYERESVPYKAVDGLIDALSRYLVRLPKAEAASLLPRQAALVTQVFPVLARVEPFAEAPRGSEVRDPQELRSRLFGALRELFARLADRKPLVLIIDDLQWADADSLALLAELTRPPEAPALLLVATVRDRSAGGEASGPNAMATSTALAVELRHLQLSRMPSEEARELAQLLIARVAGRPDIDARAVAEEAGGHPLFIDELIRHSHSGQTPALHLEDALWSRISQLEPAARAVLELTALAGGRLLQQTALQAAALDAASFGKQVGLLRVAHLVRTSGTRATDYIEPYHDRVRAAVLAHVDELRARSQHRRLALALEAAKHADPEALALHWREAGESARAAEYSAQAALKAARALAFDRAAQLYGDCLALGLLRDGDGRDLRIKRADALANGGRGAEAAAVYNVAADAASPGDALDLRRRAAEQLLRSGHVDEGLATLRTVLGAVGMRLAGTPARALASLVVGRARFRLRGLRFKERSEAQLPAETLMRIDACCSAALCLSVVDNIRGAEFQARHMLLALDAGEPYRVARALAMEASIISTAGERVSERVARLLAASVELGNRIGHPHAIGLAALAGGVAAFQRGRWAEARERCSAADRVFRERCTGVAWEIVTTQLFRLSALGFLGELGELQREVPAMIQEAEARGDLYALTNLRVRPLPFACLAAGDVALARQQAEVAMSQWPRGNFLAQHYYQIVALANADLYTGDGRSAWRRVRESWPALERSMFTRVQGIRIESQHLRGRTALAALREGEEPRAALAAVNDATARLLGEGLPWALGLGRLLQAGVASVMGDQAGAAALLDEAARLLDGCDMRLHAAAARRRRGGGAAVEAFMTAQRIRQPSAMTAMLVPGFPD